VLETSESLSCEADSEGVSSGGGPEGGFTDDHTPLGFAIDTATSPVRLRAEILQNLNNKPGVIHDSEHANVGTIPASCFHW
jgi:hypothetical protein